MDLETIRLVREVLPQGKTLYFDFADRYAVILLEQFIGGEHTKISDIKQGHLEPLLSKPCIKRVVADLGRPWITCEDLAMCWPHDPTAYKLTLDVWPGEKERPRRGWNQVTRWGWNLVLQLNVASEHKSRLGSDVPDWQEFNVYDHHPVQTGRELTLAWSRIDLDFDEGEALIEEIQSDWVRDVKWYSRNLASEEADNWRRYEDATLKPVSRKWPEIMLSATLWFIFEELGISRVFYHTHGSGSQLKKIQYSRPPRSIYSDLPRRFCFRTTHNGPAFIRDYRNKEVRNIFLDPATKWFVHDFN